MSNDFETIEKSNVDISHRFDSFDYPFHKIDIVLLKKAIDDLVLPNSEKNNARGEN